MCDSVLYHNSISAVCNKPNRVKIRLKNRGVMIIVVGDTASSVEINAGERIGDPSKMAAAQYVGSNRQHQSMGRLPIYVYASHYMYLHYYMYLS